MCNLQIAPDKIVEIIVEKGIEPLCRFLWDDHLRYIFHYKQNVEDLVAAKILLETAGRTVQDKIVDAQTRGDDIVAVWPDEAKEVIKGVETFMQAKAAKENVKCFKFSGPNFISQYKLSKEAKNKMDEVKKKAGEADSATISRPKPPPPELEPLFSGDYMDFGSREKVFDMILKALADPKVTMLGVYGTGGVGKTTMVKKVGHQVKNDGVGNQVNKDVLFDEVVIAVASQEANIGKIQDKIAADLKLKWNEQSESPRNTQLWNRLNNGKRNLVILDDVWEKLDLKDIGIPVTDGNKSCKIVLTSRNRQVLKAFCGDCEEAYNDFPIEVLLEDDAWNLFKKKVGNNVESHDPLHEVAKKVCEECGGLPVAIHAVAAALKGKLKVDWESALDKLKKSMPNAIAGIDERAFNGLRLSYDHLPPSGDEKSCFMLCCSFPEDSQIPINQLVRHCMARRLLYQDPASFEEARRTVCAAVNTLKTRCLLLDGEDDDFVKMHDVIRDVGIAIAKEEKRFLAQYGVQMWPEPRTYEDFSAISLSSSEPICELPNELGCQKLHTLKVESNIKLPDRFFSGTKKLVVLELKSVVMSSPLPSSLEELKELRMLCLNECKLGDIRKLECLKNTLEVLSLRGSGIEALPHEIGELTRLRLLDLGECPDLKVIPSGVISKLVRLEELYFPPYFKNWEAATGNEERSKSCLDKLTPLTRLSTLEIRVPYLQQLHVHLFSPNLIRFDIQVGSVRYDGLIEDCSSQGVMWIEGMCCEDGLNIWKRLLGKQKWFNNLTQLQIVDCDSLKYLFSPSSARELQQLQFLEIKQCVILLSVIGNEGEPDEEINKDVINFSQLKVLELVCLPCLISFYPRIKKATTESQSLSLAQGLFNEKVAFPALERLHISALYEITAIWDMQTFSIPEKESNSSFSNLRAMEVEDCSNLENVVKGFSNMEVRGTEEIKESQVANYVLQFPQLKSLELVDLEILSSFSNTSLINQTRPLFNDQVAFHALEKLRIDSLRNITEIWDNSVLPTKLFGQLRSLTVEVCEKLTSVVSSHSLPLIRNMVSLHIENCPAMEVIVVLKKRGEETKEATSKDIIQFSKLTKLTLEELENLKGFCADDFEDQLHFNMEVAFTEDSSSTQLQIKDTSIIAETRPLFNHKVAFPALEELTIVSMPNITEIWDKNVLPAQSFCLLRSLEVCNCGKLINVIPSHMLPVLQNIGSLIIKKFSEMEVIVVLEKRDEETQEATNKAIIRFPKLTKLVLQELDNLKGVCAYKSEGQLNFNVQSTLPALEVLRIESLPMITTVWSIQTFTVPENIAELSFSQSRIKDISLITETRPLFNLQGCETLINTVPSHMLPVIQNIEYLDVGGCSEMEEIIVLEKREEEAEEATNKDIIVFPKLLKLALQRLQKLKGVCAYKSRDHLYLDVQVVFPELSDTVSTYYLKLDAHSRKIFKEAVSRNKEMLDAFARLYGDLEDDSEDEDVMEDQEDASGDGDEETHEKEKAGPSEKRPTETTATRTPLLDKDDLEDHSKDEDEKTPKKVGPSQKSLTKATSKSLAPDEDGLEDEDNSRTEDEEAPKKAGPSERKPIESATKTPIMGEDDKEDEDEETPKKAKVAQREDDD